MPQYIYMLREREFIASNQDIYKIGRSSLENCIRVVKYPKSSELISKNSCFDCHELENYLINLFKHKYVQRSDIGAEYFEGDVIQMQNDICMAIVNDSYHRSIQSTKIPDTKKTKSKKTTADETLIPVISPVIDMPIPVITPAVIDIPIPVITPVVDMPIPVITPVIDMPIPVITNVINMPTSVNIPSEIECKIGEKLKYVCKMCDFSGKAQCRLETHFLSIKHIENIEELKNNGEQTTLCDPNRFYCKTCSKRYKHASGLSAHSKSCREKNNSK